MTNSVQKHYLLVGGHGDDIEVLDVCASDEARAKALPNRLKYGWSDEEIELVDLSVSDCSVSIEPDDNGAGFDGIVAVSAIEADAAAEVSFTVQLSAEGHYEPQNGALIYSADDIEDSRIWKPAKPPWFRLMSPLIQPLAMDRLWKKASASIPLPKHWCSLKASTQEHLTTLMDSRPISVEMPTKHFALPHPGSPGFLFKRTRLCQKVVTTRPMK